MSSNPTIAALEQKYIELLRKKVASLEISVSSSELTNGSKLAKKGSNSSMTAVNGDAEKLSVPPHRDPIHHCSSLQLLIAPKSSTQAQAAETGSRDETAVRSSIRFRQRKYNHIRGYMEETDVSNDPITKKEEVNAEVRVHAVTLLRCFNELDRYSFSGITVEDDGLKALLFYALSHHPYFGHWEHMATASPFEPFIHNWSRLNAFVSDDISNPVVAGFYKELESVGSTDRLAFLQDRTTRNKAIQNLRELLQLIQDTPGLESYFTGARETPEVAESVAFEYLWTIFPPGEIVVSRPFMGRLQAFIVKESTDEVKRRRRGEAEFWNLQCWTYDWDGTEFNRMPVQFTFEQYKGFKSISSLPCYPMKFHKGTSNDDKDLGKIETPKALEEALIKRGKRFRELCLRKEGCQLFEYDGSALSSGTGVRKQPKNINQEDSSGSRSLDDWTPMRDQQKKASAKTQMIKSDRVMVDFASYISHSPQSDSYASMGELEFVDDDEDFCRCSECMENEKLRKSQKADYDNVKAEQKWEDSQYLICPPRVLGYHFQSKQWVELDVNKVQDIKKLKDPRAFNSLQLPKTQKTLIENLVSCHGVKDEDRSMRDLMMGKGNGLVILLHGPPGVGKTLTAESVAKATGKPLFSVSVSDIGLKPSEVERNLEVLFELAAKWRAVMLFDEADVFLESRSSNTSNLERNALVSILLRILEYYDGILILTTNRIRTFDIAVQSRINLAIRYNELSNDQKKKIYLNFIEQLNEENTEDKEQLRDFVIKDEDEPPFMTLNGRQIRNVLFSAASLAKAESDHRLRQKHIDGVLTETKKFQRDIQVMIDMARQEAEIGRT